MLGTIRLYSNIELDFERKVVPVYGLADMMTVTHGQGHGKVLVDAFIRYYNNLPDASSAAIGFCEKENSSFYLKCGLAIAESEGGKFEYRGDEKKPWDMSGCDVVYYPGNSEFMRKLVNGDEKVFTGLAYYW
ncbi:MAG: hypothetical protein ACOCXT_04585 [Candidatus Dojkabacteria bacterium]